MNKEFSIIDDKIYFGITNIKGVGESVFDSLLSLYLDCINKNIMGIIPTFCRVLTKINSAAAKAIVSVGAFDEYRIPRTELLFYLDMLNKLTAKELEQVINSNIDITSIKFKDIFVRLLKECKVVKKRQLVIQEFINSIDHPPYSLKDNMQWIAETEGALLGIPLTCTKTDCYIQNYESNLISCKEFKSIANGKKVAIMGEISRLSITKTKQGKNKGAAMSFLEIFDSSGGIDSVVLFPEQYSVFKDLLKENEVLVFIGSKSNKGGSGLIVEKCFIPES